MDPKLKEALAKFDRRTNDRTLAYIELNNLYLLVESGRKALTVGVKNRLNVLAGQAYEQADPMRDYWRAEFEKLDNWNLI